MPRFYRLLIYVPVLLLLPASLSADSPRRSPISDSVYLQEIGHKIKTDFPLTAVAVWNGEVFLGSDAGLMRLERDRIVPDHSIPAAIRELKMVSGALWALSEEGLYRNAGAGWQQIRAGRVLAFCEHLGKTHIATPEGVFVLAGETLSALAGCPVQESLIDMVSYAETLYFLYPGRLVFFDGSGIESENVVDWGALPSQVCRDMLSLGSRLLIPTDRGVAILRGMSMTLLTGKEGLCQEDTTCLAEGFADDLWIGTRRGAVRSVNGEFHYFNADRWLPHEEVHAIARGQRVVYIATTGGLGLMEYEPYTLAKKAAYYERHLEEWGQKRLGFVHKLEWDDELGEWVREVSDNDCGWSTHYLAAMSFKYAVTGDDSARAEAANTFNSLKWAQDITPIGGYPARAIWAKGEKGHKTGGGSGGYPAEWIDTPDGVWEWKSDTSSDEIDAHCYVTPIFHDLAAQGEEKARAVEFFTEMVRHIIDSGWYLKDLDGLPTVWGRWEPEYLQRPIGSYARGLNGLEILAFVETARALSDDSKFDSAHKQLLDWGYHKEVVRQKLTFPPGNIFHSDDRLAMYVYHSLLRYTKDPELRSLYRRSLERSWEIERIEHVPWFNFIYGALTGNDCELDQAANHLREWPLDLIKYNFHNSHRRDIDTPMGYTPYCGGVRPFSPRETNGRRWIDSWLEPDGGSGAREVEDPSGWLDAYWMARYHGMITAPATNDPELTTVPRRGLRLGAEPYTGPPRPER